MIRAAAAALNRVGSIGLLCADPRDETRLSSAQGLEYLRDQSLEISQPITGSPQDNDSDVEVNNRLLKR
jgi:hypothetical protein